MATPTVTDHAGLEVLGLDACIELLRASRLGRIAFVVAGEPEVLPVGYGVDGTSVVFRSTIGTKLGAAVDRDPVTFEVDTFDQASGTGWSVVLKGVCEVVVDPDDVSRLDASGVPQWVKGQEMRWVRVRPDTISGRRLVA